MIKGFEHWDEDIPKNNRDAIAHMFVDYGHKPLDLSYADIKIAIYDEQSWSGSAFVLFKDDRDGEYYEVNASHCSCYGLEGQWEPEKIEPRELANRPFILSDKYDEVIRQFAKNEFAEHL